MILMKINKKITNKSDIKSEGKESVKRDDSSDERNDIIKTEDLLDGNDNEKGVEVGKDGDNDENKQNGSILSENENVTQTKEKELMENIKISESKTAELNK